MVVMPTTGMFLVSAITPVVVVLALLELGLFRKGIPSIRVRLTIDTELKKYDQNKHFRNKSEYLHLTPLNRPT